MYFSTLTLCAVIFYTACCKDFDAVELPLLASISTLSHAGCQTKINRGGLTGWVEQLTRYLELLNRGPLLAPVHGIFAVQEIKLRARTLAEDRGIRCVTLDYEAMRGVMPENTLF